MNQFDLQHERLGNRLAAGKQPFRIKFGMTGVLPKPRKKVLRVLQVL